MQTAALIGISGNKLWAKAAAQLLQEAAVSMGLFLYFHMHLKAGKPPFYLSLFNFILLK